MTHEEMLKKMGLTKEEHKDLLTKFTAFHNSLNANQQKVIARSMPSAKDAAKSFGPGVTAEHLHSLTASASISDGSGCQVALTAPADGS